MEAAGLGEGRSFGSPARSACRPTARAAAPKRRIARRQKVMTSATQESFPAGWYGKIPGTGDFITRRMPPAFSESWDRWLQSAIAGSRDRLGGRWRDTFLSMPIWRFVLSPGMLTPNAWAGIMAPSVDAVGRYFPLAVAAALPSASLDIVGTLMGAQSWFDDIEAIALSAIAPAADSAAIDAAIVQKPCRAERSEEHTSELQSHSDLVCRLLLEKKKKNTKERQK